MDELMALRAKISNLKNELDVERILHQKATQRAEDWYNELRCVRLKHGDFDPCHTLR